MKAALAIAIAFVALLAIGLFGLRVVVLAILGLQGPVLGLVLTPRTGEDQS